MHRLVFSFIGTRPQSGSFLSQANIARRLALLLMPLIGLATLLEGSVFWLRRVGWLQAEQYWRTNEALILQSGFPADSLETFQYVMSRHASLHHLDGWFQVTKYPREMVLVAFVALALLQLSRFRPTARFGIPWAGMALLAAASASAALFAGQWFALLAGARSLGAWCIGAFAGPLVDVEVRRRLARVCAWTLLAEAVLAAMEVRRGMLIYTLKLFDSDMVRVVGTFNLPSSLGVFTVVACAVAWCWSGYPRRVLFGLTAVLILLLVVNASAVAWAALGAIALALAYSRLRARWRPLFLAAVLPIALLGWQALPIVTGRWDVQNSLWGRIAPVASYAADHLSTRELLFGKGFGLGTNALGNRSPPLKLVGGLPDGPVGDSMPAALFWQFGLLGVTFAYALFAVALFVDSSSRAIGIALLVSTIAINITELFPVNLILGFWLANAAAVSRRSNEPN